MASDSDLTGVLETMKGRAALVVGDVMLDRFVYGRVDRISPESPVPALTIEREESMLGGAGNALANLAGLGLKGSILTVVGADANGALVRQMIRKAGFEDRGVLTDSSRPTIQKTRFLAGHQQLLRADAESRVAISPRISAALLKKAKALLKKSGALVVSDYGKGLLTPGFLKDLIAAARMAGVPVLVDPKGLDFSVYKGADAITPNRKELAEASGMPVDTDSEVVAAARKIIKTCGVDAVVATRSRDGMTVVRKNAEPLHIRGHEIEVFDVSGAGDAVIATLAAAIAAEADLESAARLANLAGSIVVTKVGTAPIRFDELEEAAQGGETIFAYADKKAPLMSSAAAAEQARRWRAKGLKVGFTNGCFDILHAGHVSYLNAARGECDRLIVGLNRDASVKILKGPERPVHDEASRAAVLAALAGVDMVVLFGAEKPGQDNTASALLRALRPDVYFKGGDYRESQIPEAPAVRAFGGSIKMMPNFEGHSTTRSIRKIRKSRKA